MRPRRHNCKEWDLLTDAEKDPDSNIITQQEYEEALAAAKAQKVCEWYSRSQAALALAGPHLFCPAEEAAGGG